MNREEEKKLKKRASKERDINKQYIIYFTSCLLYRKLFSSVQKDMLKVIE